MRDYPWGDARYNAGSQVTKYRFTGQAWDGGTGLYFYGARWYDPAVGRFLQADTIVPSPGDPQSLNRYSYVGNRPLNMVDPTGHFGEGIAIRFPGQSLVGALAIAAEAVDPLPADLVVIPFGLSLIASDPLWQLLPQYAQQLDAASQQADATRQQSNGQGGNSANLDPNDPRFKQSIAKDLQKIYDRYSLDSGYCEKAAQKAFGKLTDQGYRAQIARFQIREGVAGKGMRFLQLNDGRVISSSRGATGAFHDIVRVGNRVFDALTGAEGMLFDEYMAKFWSDMYEVEKTIELLGQ